LHRNRDGLSTLLFDGGSVEEMKRTTCRVAATALVCVCSACADLHKDAKIGIGVAVVGTIIASQTPTTDIEQVYYLGVFDPQDQLPPTIYRVRVRGQASAISSTKYASGWVRAELIDSLSTVVSFKQSGELQITRADELQGFATGRRLVMFGPEGFREAPAGHRLVIAMGSSPEKFFQAIDETLGHVASVTQGQGGADLERTLFRDLVRVRNERERVQELLTDAKADKAAMEAK
jgi:hypothetical protein